MERISWTQADRIDATSRASLAGTAEQLIVGDDFVDEAPGERGGRVDEVAGEAHLAGPSDADRLGAARP